MPVDLIAVLIRGLGLRTKLVLAFLSLASLVALAGMAGLFFTQRGSSQVSYLTEVVTPFRVESVELLRRQQSLQWALFSALATALDTRDAGEAKRRMEAVQRNLAEVERTEHAAIDRLRGLAGRAGLDLPLDAALQAQQRSAALMGRIIEHDIAEKLSLTESQSQMLRFRDGRRKFDDVLQAVASRAGAQITIAEEQSKISVQAGTATIASLEALISDTLTNVYPRLQSANRLMQVMVRLDELAIVHAARTDLALLSAIEAEARALLQGSKLILHWLDGRLQSSGEGSLAEVAAPILQDVEVALTGPAGAFRHNRDAFAHHIGAEADWSALHAIKNDLGTALSSVEQAARALETQVSTAARQSAREALIGLVTVAAFSTLLAVGLGLFCATRLVRPLKQLRDAVVALAPSRPLPDKVRDLARGNEIGSIAASVLERAAYLATHDALTDLPNRALFGDRLVQALAAAHRNGGSVAVLCLDLDRFKEVNDTLGHAAGDKLLSQVAGRIRAILRDCDTLARLGGDEFAIVQHDASQPEDSEALVNRIIAAITLPFDLDGHQAVIGVSVGIAVRNGAEAAVSPGLLMQEADVALYRAKEEGRGTFRFFQAEMNQRLRERKALEADLRRALADGEFQLHYQPQVSQGDHAIIGAEALLRWRHPERGDVGPAEFIPLAEETGLIGALGEWVLRGACRQAAAWPALRRMAVNVSPTQFRQPGFLQTVEAALRDSGLEPTRLELEITEGVLLQDTEAMVQRLNQLHALGVAIAMDDFGTGYSSLGYLRQFHFDKIKIDQSFIHGLSEDADALAIVRAVIGMSQALGIRINAEGVEEPRQADLLRSEGCEEMQGWLFSRAVTPAEFETLLASGTAAPAESTELEG